MPTTRRWCNYWTPKSGVSTLVNDRVEILRGFGRMQTALDVCLQSILRKSGPFVKPNSSLAASKHSKDKAITCAMSLASNAAKKKRSRGIGRKVQDLSPHIIPSPVLAPSATSKTVPAAQARRGLQKSKSGSGTHSSSPDREKHRMLPPSTRAQSDLWAGLSGRHQQTF